MLPRNTNIDGLSRFLASPESALISHDLASLTIFCGEAVFPHTPLTFGHLVDMSDYYGSSKYDSYMYVVCRDSVGQTWPRIAIVRFRTFPKV